VDRPPLPPAQNQKPRKEKRKEKEETKKQRSRRFMKLGADGDDRSTGALPLAHPKKAHWKDDKALLIED
jgi:hypothetical protein